MDEQVYSLGPVMKAARKFKKFNQADVAQAIGCSQSALSKMEHNLLIPSAPQWFLFARFTAIPPESLETGHIDRHSKVKFNDDQVSLGFKIPKRYRHFKALKVRELYPFLKYIETKMSKEQLKEFIASTGLENEFFLDFDNLVNFQMFLDSIDFLIKAGRHSLTDIHDLVAFQNEVYWDHFGVEWKKLGTVRSVLDEYVLEQSFFQTDFQVKVDFSGEKLLLSYFPEFHLKQFAANATPEILQFLNNYRSATMEHLVDRVLGQKVVVDLIPGAQSSPLGARFEVRSYAS